jgi:Type II restriction endonuclease, TdeIII
LPHVIINPVFYKLIMALTSTRITEITKAIVKKAFFNYFLCREEVGTKHVVLSRFFPEESVVRSAIGGIETSLGSFWEKIAEALAAENGFEILDSKNDIQEPKTIPTSISHLLDHHKYQRELPHANVPMTTYISALNDEIKKLSGNAIPSEYKRLSKGTGVDVFIRKGSVEYAFEIKTVQINAGSGPKFNDTLMKWITFRSLQQKHLNLNNSFNAHLVIPYDPHVDSDWWTEFGDRAYPLDHKDLLLGDEFWNLLSGAQNTLAAITQAFDELAKEGFQDIYKGSIYKCTSEQRIHIIESVCGVKCESNTNLRAEDISAPLKWKCNKCSSSIDKSIKWFAGYRKCPSCDVSLFN